VSSVGEGRVAEDHPVEPIDDGEYELRVTKVTRQGEGDYEEASPGWEGDLRAILYVGGKIATCDSVRDTSLELVWQEGDGTDAPTMRAICGSYRWARFLPGYLPYVMLILVVVLFLALIPLRVYQRRSQAGAEREGREAEKRRKEEEQFRRDAIWDKINFMSGLEFERFMAEFFRQKGYAVQETRATGDQGVDLLLDIGGKKVAVQLKRWVAPVGNAAVSATFAGMAHYQADEGWVITTSTFTKSARELARSTKVRLIDGKELADWLEGLRERE
jgi:Restriction endonuclease